MKLNWLYRYNVMTYLRGKGMKINDGGMEISGDKDWKSYKFYMNGDTPVFECRDLGRPSRIIFQMEVPEEPHLFEKMMKVLDK